MIVNVCFHGIGVCKREREPGEGRYWVTQDVFRGVLDGVAGREDVGLSFDDGNRSDLDVALPALRERGLRATFFALAGRLDDPASLSAGDLRSLGAAGMAIGSHGWAHVPWRGLDPSQARREFIDARTVLEDAAGARITEAAMPLGRYDRRALRGLRSAGYDTVYSSDRFPARPGSWLQARYSATSDDTVETILAAVGRRPGLADARSLAKSLIKRIR
ncbi:MAG: polysaccharide deacetylase family protein [Microbacterium sp.]